MTREDNYIPLYMRPSSDRKPLKAEVIPSRKELFAALNKFVTERGGWLTSIPGAVDVTMECLPGSSLPDVLRKFGRGRAHPTERDCRTLRCRCRRRDGATRGSSRAVALTVTHAGICKVTRYAFDMP